jgi:hypothetical protein
VGEGLKKNGDMENERRDFLHKIGFLSAYIK